MEALTFGFIVGYLAVIVWQLITAVGLLRELVNLKKDEK